MKVMAAMRLFAGRKQVDVANMLGVNIKTISSWETGETKPPVDMVPKIAEVYKVPANILFEYFTGKQIQVAYSIKECA